MRRRSPKHLAVPARHTDVAAADSREEQERQSDTIAKAVKDSGLRYAVHLSSYGAHVPEGTGPVTGPLIGTKTKQDAG